MRPIPWSAECIHPEILTTPRSAFLPRRDPGPTARGRGRSSEPLHRYAARPARNPAATSRKQQKSQSLQLAVRRALDLALTRPGQLRYG